MPRRRSKEFVPSRVVGARFDIPTADRFYDMTEALGTTQSDVVRNLVQAWMRDHADEAANQEAIPGTTAQLAS